MNAASAVHVAVTFVWLGMVLAISFLETPLKFRAPGITVPLGVGIGRLVFRALNLVEAVLAIALVITLAMAPGVTWWRVLLVVAVCVVLAAGAGVLRPLMDARVRRTAVSDKQPRHLLHVGYIALEFAKVVLLLAIGVAAFAA